VYFSVELFLMQSIAIVFT